MEREYIAYAGKKFTIEWYIDSRGKSSALEYFKSLSAQERMKVLHLFKRMGDAGEIKDTTKFNYEGDHIYAFKPKPERFLCFFFVGNKIIVTNAFRKKQDKLPRNEKDRAERNKKDYEIRVKKGEYYGQD
jgi:phage-related protein